MKTANDTPKLICGKVCFDSSIILTGSAGFAITLTGSAGFAITLTGSAGFAITLTGSAGFELLSWVSVS